MNLFNQNIFDGVKASLERLQLDYVDVLQCKYHTNYRQRSFQILTFLKVIGSILIPPLLKR